MLDLDCIPELFEEAQGYGREYFGEGFQLEHRSPRRWPCKACGLPWWLHDRLGCRPPIEVQYQVNLGLSRGYWRQRRYELRKGAVRRARRKARAR